MTISRREFLITSALGVAAAVAFFISSRLVTAPTEVMMPTWVPFLKIL